MKEQSLAQLGNQFLKLSGEAYELELRLLEKITPALEKRLDTDLKDAIIEFQPDHVKVVEALYGYYGVTGHDWDNAHFFSYEEIG
jgi:hypothetical protein